MNFEKQTLLVGILSFAIILLLGIYLTISEAGGYDFTFRNRGGSVNSYFINGPVVIGIALLLGAIMLVGVIASRDDKKKRSA
ncbi:MAG: hypothetical protein KIS94_15615 [Chitinophagales bacterium]|nr:hypothetical protein [Chitinophagales bacterium]